MAFLSFGKREGKMKTQIKNEINTMRLAGAKASEIASHLGIPASTVRTHIRRHPEIPNTVVCPTCGKRVMLGASGRKKKYCSDRCRMAWWNSHPEAIRRKAYYMLTCQHCGKEFESYGNQKRKYCSRACYDAERRSLQAG